MFIMAAKAALSHLKVFYDAVAAAAATLWVD